MAARVLERVNEQVLASLPPGQRRDMTIGVLDVGISDTSAIVMVARGREQARYYRYRGVGGQWTVGEELRVRDDAIAPLDPGSSNVDWEGEIAALTLYTQSQEYMYHIWDVKAGSYVAHKYTSSAGPGQNSGFISGGWFGGTQWLADTLFQLKFSRYDYAANGYWCAWGPKSSSQMYTSFSTAAQYPYFGTCGATDVHLWYSIRKLISPVVANFTSGPTTVTTASTYQWGLTVSGGFNDEYSYTWERSTDGGSSWSGVCGGASYQCSLSVSYGDPSFVLRATVSSGGYTEYPTRTVSVHIPGPNDPPAGYTIITGPSELAHQEWGEWTATLSNAQSLTSCDWYVDGQAAQMGGSCTYGDSWGDGTTQHLLTVVAHGTIDYPAADKAVTVIAQMECGPEGCMARRKKPPVAPARPGPARRPGSGSSILGQR